MELRAEDRHDWRILTPDAARLDAFVSQSLRTQLTESVSDGCQRVVIDLKDVAFMDSSGLGALVFFRQFLGEGAEIVLAEAQPSVVTILKLTHLDKVFELADDLDKVVDPVV